MSTPTGEFRVAVSASRPAKLAAKSAPLATAFGRTVDAPLLTCRIHAALPMRISTVWHRAGNARLTTARQSAFALEGAM